MIERIHLSILREIKKVGTLTGAADRLCLTQSALSHAIKRLENQFNTPLWTKEGRTLLITYPVAIERLDIFTGFLLPANCRPGRHKVVENTEIMLQMVEAGRGVTALPDWLLKEYAEELSISSVRIGAKGIHKQIFVGVRKDDAMIDYIRSFIEFAEDNRR